MLYAMFFLGFLAAAAVFAPLLMVWMLNTLFSLHLPYDFATWFAALLLLSMFAALVAR